MRPRMLSSLLEFLQANAHRPEVQERIRREIIEGKIRVRPAPDGGIEIVPVESDGAEKRPIRNLLPTFVHS
jgi:hypothetical protein